jgi:hypothetical protein
MLFGSNKAKTVDNAFKMHKTKASRRRLSLDFDVDD